MKKLPQVLFVGEFSVYSSRQMIQGTAAYVRQTGSLELYHISCDDDPLHQIKNIDDWTGDGMIVCLDNPRAACFTIDRMPIVGIGGGAEHHRYKTKIPFFSTDNREIGHQGAEHLINCGFKNFAFCGYPGTYWSKLRAEAFKKRINEAGHQVQMYSGLSPNSVSHRDITIDLCRWIISLKKPCALMACNDARARHVVNACNSLGLHIPDNIAVLGVDNDELICDMASTPISSIEQGAWQIGYEAIATIDRMLSGQEAKNGEILIGPSRLIERHSTEIVSFEDEYLTHAVSFIAQHACDPIDVNDVLRVIPLSRSTLEKRFQEVLGRSIHSEILRVKIKKTKRLLEDSKLLIKNIATRSGFSTAEYMSTVFRKHTGLTPLEYRRQFLH